MKADVTPFFDEVTCTATYVVADPESRACAVIDSVLDYDPANGRTSTANADKVIAFVEQNALSAAWILETHAHADHLTAARYLKEQLGGRTGIGRRLPASSIPSPRSSTVAPRLPRTARSGIACSGTVMPSRSAS